MDRINIINPVPPNMGSNRAAGNTVKSVERAFNVIGILREHAPMTVSALAEMLDIPTSTVHLHLKTLEHVGYATKDDGEYCLSMRFLRDGVAVRNRNQLYNVSADEIDELAAKTNEVAALGVEEEGQRVLLYQSKSDEAVYDNALTAEYTNMHWSALGKAILAHLPDDRTGLILGEHGLPTQTKYTISDPETLEGTLSTIRERGYSVEDEERRIGIRSVSVPVIVDEGVVGAISVSGPKNRIHDERIEEELLPALRDAVNVIEVKYVY